ncbi:MAG TPA: Hsp20/alpha crystallin family protein [Polyangiaceae bacterium]|jgi:HSP20 family protein|nr:Hsp20/alpha crystallin family protein [Polyangiaceae bacterium]
MLGMTKKNETAPAVQEPRPVAPALDVYENDTEFLLIADLPGVAQGGAEVTLDHDRLVLSASGARKFRREIAVPPSVEADKVSAAMKAGVLTVHLPKRAPYQPRQIQVQNA